MKGWTRDDVAGLVRDGKAKVHLPFREVGPGENVTVYGQAKATQAERDAAHILQNGFGWEAPVFQGLRIELASGHVYTADLWFPDRRAAVEVKGYRHPSVGRSRLAFDQARIERPDLHFVWMERKKASRGKPDRWVIEWVA